MEPVEIILDKNTNPINQEIHIEVPAGYEIDRENSTFECIKLKPVKKSKFSDYDGTYEMMGYYLNNDKVDPLPTHNRVTSKDVFATEKYAKSALAMAQISQIMANDERFGGAITDGDWEDETIIKHCIFKYNNKLTIDSLQNTYHLLAFYTRNQRDLFLKENEQLVKDYLMID